MILDLTRIRQPETDVQRQYPPTAFEGRDNTFRIASPVTLRMRVSKDRDRFRLVGALDTTLELSCSRCLEPFDLPVEAAFDVRYLPDSENVGTQEREVADDELVAAFYRDDQVDLAQLIEEQLYLALPMKPLCTPDCRGLCPHCGANLNHESCSCEVRWEDPRLAGLKAILTERKTHDA
jgi:uncharacterized protein